MKSKAKESHVVISDEIRATLVDQATEDASADVAVEACQGWICHARWYFLSCLGRENTAWPLWGPLAWLKQKTLHSLIFFFSAVYAEGLFTIFYCLFCVKNTNVFAEMYTIFQYKKHSKT